MTVTFHQIKTHVPRDLRYVVVYYDTYPASLDTLAQVYEHLPAEQYCAIPVDTSYHDLPPQARAFLPAPPLADGQPMTFPYVVAVYDGDVLSWSGHRPTTVAAWVTSTDTVAAYLTRSHHRTDALDEGAVTHWDISYTAFSPGKTHHQA